MDRPGVEGLSDGTVRVCLVGATARTSRGGAGARLPPRAHCGGFRLATGYLIAQRGECRGG
jgi:hypothetical protein